MISDPYTYVTMSINPGGPAYLGVSFYSADIQVRASTVDSGRPYLDIACNTVHVQISTAGAGPVTDRDLDLARQIRDAASRYLADCQRLHLTARSADPGDTAL
ncbi:hypothetical protein Misp01_54600 [Microtetraspora sp. NBRC 13810]|uniref:4a-hydroxytetrahydrobiopterin dehydratase n=1 Tax=Microtetraspora sp. NBRC 13810 TaxID=3030990 RepID=UPI0024A0A0B6|nr:4a-hydroxytetrahydrobiopterin dehydratase [Microtetraspora sp. NBRC 13810]GLW10332.1 hypothetical protein Misp01_54600 [Microtetraspora sp. NBRC 13810]